MIILVTGSRDWVDEEIIYHALKTYTYNYAYNTVIHGGASGADAIADKVAKDLKFNVKTFPANWNQYGKRAGYLRNKQMVDLGPDICLAFIKNNSRGATMCAELAINAGIPTHYFRQNFIP